MNEATAFVSCVTLTDHQRERTKPHREKKNGTSLLFKEVYGE